METREFENIGGLRDVAEGLARASRHPVHVDLGREYGEVGTPRLDQDTLDDEDVADRLDEVAPQSDLHAVWNSRDDRRAYIGSGRYNLIQHREVLDAITTAVDGTTGSIEKGVVRDYGEYVTGVLVFGDREDAVVDVRELVGEGYLPPEGADWTRDRLGLGMRFHNSFNGRSGYGGSTMAYRYICQNWMVWGEETIEEKSAYHIKGEEDAPGVDPEYFEGVIASVFEERDPLAGVVKGAAEDGELPVEWAPGLLEDAGFGANYAKRITRRMLEQETRREGETNLWNLYNAATAHLDHDKLVDVGPERYDHHQECAWDLLTSGVEAPEDEVEDVEAYVTGVSFA